MNYNSLKGIVSIKAFQIIQNLINCPTANLYIANYESTTITPIFDPYDSTADEMIDVTPNPLEFIKNVDVIYTYDRNLITNDNSTLGSIYSMSVYLRNDDIPEGVLDTKNSLVIELNKVFYKIKNTINAYGIIVQFELEN